MLGRGSDSVFEANMAMPFGSFKMKLRDCMRRLAAELRAAARAHELGNSSEDMSRIKASLGIMDDILHYIQDAHSYIATNRIFERAKCAMTTALLQAGYEAFNLSPFGTPAAFVHSKGKELFQNLLDSVVRAAVQSP